MNNADPQNKNAGPVSGAGGMSRTKPTSITVAPSVRVTAASSKLHAIEVYQLEQLESIIGGESATVIEVNDALRAIRDSCLYRGGYRSFSEYCRHEWGMDRNDVEEFSIIAEFVREFLNRVEAFDPADPGRAHCFVEAEYCLTHVCTAWWPLWKQDWRGYPKVDLTLMKAVDRLVSIGLPATLTILEWFRRVRRLNVRRETSIRDRFLCYHAALGLFRNDGLSRRDFAQLHGVTRWKAQQVMQHVEVVGRIPVAARSSVDDEREVA